MTCGRRSTTIAAALAVIGLLGAGCRGSDSPAAPDSADEAAAIEVVAPSPTAGVDEPDDGPDRTVPTVAVPTATPSPPPPPIAPVSLDWVLGFAPDGDYAYESLGAPWEAPAPCDDERRQAVIGIDLNRSDGGEVAGFVAGVEVVGTVHQLTFDDDGTGLVLSACLQGDDEVRTLTPVVIGDRGRLVETGAAIVLPTGSYVNGPWIGGISDGFVSILGHVEAADPPGEWRLTIRHLELSTGAIEIEDSDLSEDEIARRSRSSLRSPDGRFSYREIADPAGRLGCEGFGVAATVGIDRGQGYEPVWGADQPAYANVIDLHFGPDGLIAWTSSCEGFDSLHVGRMLDDGSIVDHHFIDTYDASSEDGFTELRHFRLAADGDVVALGQRFDASYENPEPIFRRIDLTDDPAFIETGDRPPAIDTTNPLAPTLAGTGAWFLGDSPEGSTRCGNGTLYASTTAGHVLGLPSHDGLDAIVGLVVSEPWTVDYGDGVPMPRRAVVVLTECPELYDGRLIWFGEERPVPSDGIWVLEADLGPVADVLSVRAEPLDPDGFGVDTVAEVVFLDGSIGEVTLVPVPFD